MVGASRQATRSAEIPRAQLVLDKIDPAHETIHSETRTNFAHTFYTLVLELRRSELSQGRRGYLEWSLGAGPGLGKASEDSPGSPEHLRTACACPR